MEIIYKNQKEIHLREKSLPWLYHVTRPVVIIVEDKKEKKIFLLFDSEKKN